MKIRNVTLKPGEQIQISVNGNKVVLVGFEPGRADSIAVGMQGESNDFGFWFNESALRALLKAQKS